MKSLKETLSDADSRRVAIGHFNISDLAGLNAIFGAARAMHPQSPVPSPQCPVLIGVSEGEREFIGIRQAVALVKSLREEYDYPIFLNADHTHSLDKVREAADAGFDEILFDGSALPFEDNIAQTKLAVNIIRAVNPEIVIEGEIGYIGSNSEIVAERPLASLTLSTPEEAVRFMNETGVDVLAPAVGNMHGLLKEMVDGLNEKFFSSQGELIPGKAKNEDKTIPHSVSAEMAYKRLAIERIKEIKAAIGGKFMTLHGGSGTADEDFVAAVAAGMTIIHVSSELRLAWRRGMESALAAQPNEIAPYKLFPPVMDGISKIVTDRLKLFNGI